MSGDQNQTETSALKRLYRCLLPYEYRQQVYKFRHPEYYRDLRSKVYPSDKGNFSLRGYDIHQCIFVHITKTAGTSVALSLFGELPYHYSAVDYRVIFGREDFNRYWKFGFVRNPWDRLYSAYRYLDGGGWNDDDAAFRAGALADISDFEQFVMEWLTSARLNSHVHFWPQTRFICDHRGKLLLNYCARFETIAEDYSHIAAKLNIDSELASTNASKVQHDYRDAYSAAMKEKVARLYADDISLLGYEFDGYTDRGLPRHVG